MNGFSSQTYDNSREYDPFNGLEGDGGREGEDGGREGEDGGREGEKGSAFKYIDISGFLRDLNTEREGRRKRK